jgi:hypothetical protein
MAFKFNNVNVGEVFFWINPQNSLFYKRCIKISTRRYQDSDGIIYRIRRGAGNVYRPGEVKSNASSN